MNPSPEPTALRKHGTVPALRKHGTVPAAASCQADVACKTSLMLAVGHQPGALAQILTELARRGVNLTKLESRPHPGQVWHYRFYLDIAGHAASRPVAEALEAIGPLTEELRLLGTYPAAVGEPVDPATGV